MSGSGFTKEPATDQQHDHQIHDGDDIRSPPTSPKNDGRPSLQRRKAPPFPSCRVPTLTDMCRSTIHTNLERFPPEAFGILDVQEWQALMKVRFASTRPKHAGADGGLDGTGRLVPCVSHKFLTSVEEVNPDLAESTVVDDLMWKACVEYKFKRGGLTRPPALFLPWPQQIAELQQAMEELQQPAATLQEKQSAAKKLCSAPMNVGLLRDSGVGKSLKKIVKKMKKSAKEDARLLSQLENLLESWMAMATDNGVGGGGARGGGVDVNCCASSPVKEQLSEQEVDLKLAEACRSWRDLFGALKNRNEKVMLSQGKRMREKRQNLNKIRPKLVKVRPASSKQQRLLKEAKMSPSGNSKISQIRTEVRIRSAQLQKRVASSKSSFGDAVAFASISSKGAAHKRKKIGGTFHALGGGKRMKVPTAAARGARSMAPKWKTSLKK